MKIILGIVGEIAAGKGEMANYIKEKYRGAAHRSSQVLRDILGRMHLEESRTNTQRASTMIREYFGEDIISKVVAEDIDQAPEDIIAVDGLRRAGDMEYLKDNPGFRLVFIESDIRNRYERIRKRWENPDDEGKTFEQFQKDHEWETEKSIADLKNNADFVIENNGTLEEFHQNIDQLISNLNK